MECNVLVQMFDQILTGEDIPTPERMLRIKGARAALKSGGHPYSLLTNLAHAVMWQNLWLDKLNRKPKRPSMEIWKVDWRVAETGEWEGLRRDFVEGLKQARALANKPSLTSLEVETLLKIAIHASYHLGQMNLLKRMKAPSE